MRITTILIITICFVLVPNADLFAQDSSSVSRLGYYRFWKDARCVAVNGDYAYVGTAPDLHVVDISDPTQPRQAGFLAGGSIRNMAIDGDYAYVTNMDNLRILDISNPTQPQEVGRYNLDGRGDIVINGDYAYCAGYGGLIIVDISNPDDPSEAGRYETEGTTQGVAIIEDYAYITYTYVYEDEEVKDVLGCFEILDVSNPAEPQSLGLYDSLGVSMTRVAVIGEYAFIATGGEGLWVMDVSDPTEPQELAFCDSPLWNYDLVIVDDYAYLVNGDEGMWVVDVSDPTNPQEVNHYDTPGGVLDIAISGNLAYVAGNTGGLRVVDISNPAEPFEAGFLLAPKWVSNILVNGNNAYILETYVGLRVLDISDPSETRLLGSEAYPPRASGKRGIIINGDYAYIASGNLYIMNISDPETLETVVRCETPDIARDIAISGDYAYIASSDSGLSVVDISNPAESFVVGHWFQRYQQDDHFIAVEGDYAYVGDNLRGLRIIDISDPTRPTQVGFRELDWYRNQELLDVDISGNHVFVLIHEWGDGFEDGNYIQILDISSPARPRQIGLYRVPGYATGYAKSVTVVGNYAYIAAGSPGLRVINVSDPAEMYEVGYYADGASALSIGEDGLVYVVHSSRGIGTYDVSDALSASSEFIFQPSSFMLNPAYPNPFNSTTSITFTLPFRETAILTILDLSGREVARLLDGTVIPGSQRMVWEAENYPSGIYFVRLQAGSKSETVKLVLSR